MEPEELDAFERELRQSLERRPAPPGLKRKLMERRSQAAARRNWATRVFGGGRAPIWAQATAALLLVAFAGGGVRWEMDKRQEERRGEEARQQVLTALRITGHALNEVHTRLAEHDRRSGEGEQ